MDKDKIKISETTSGKLPVPGLEYAGAPEPINPKTGQHTAYWVLSKEERAKGFVRPVRRSYKHLVCGTITSMSLDIAETYARDPEYYGSTFCVTCRTHLPVGEHGNFVWIDEQYGKVTLEKVGR